MLLKAFSTIALRASWKHSEVIFEFISLKITTTIPRLKCFGIDFPDVCNFDRGLPCGIVMGPGGGGWGGWGGKRVKQARFGKVTFLQQNGVFFRTTFFSVKKFGSFLLSVVSPRLPVGKKFLHFCLV